MEKIEKNDPSFIEETKEIIKNTKLKQLIEEAKNNEIPWSYEYKIGEICWLKVKNKSLQNVLLENWNKIRHTYPSWNNFVLGGSNTLIKQIESSNKLLKKDHNNDWKFASKDILEKFKKYTNSKEELTISKWGTKKKIRDIDENDKIRSGWNTISNLLENSQKIFGRDGDSSAYQSEDAFRFFQSIIGDHANHTIRYQSSQTFKLEEWKYDDRNNLTWTMHVDEGLKKEMKGLAREIANVPSEMSNEEKSLDERYPNKKEREKVTKLKLNADKDKELDLSDFVNLEELECSCYYLTSLNVNNCKKLTELMCSFSCLTNLDLSQNKELSLLYISKDTNLVFPQSPIKLKGLYLSDKLEENLSDCCISLEHLPLSLEWIMCHHYCDHSSNNLQQYGCRTKDELALYGNNLASWQENHPKLMIKIGKELVTNSYDDKQVITTIPEYLQGELKNVQILLTNDSSTNFNYSDFFLRDPRPFTWEKKPTSTTSSIQLPLRLYNPQTDELKNNTELKLTDYAILSYCWGGGGKERITTAKINDKLSYEVNLTKLGKKALNKVKNTLALLNKETEAKLDYIWIDNFCINQSDPEEKGQEVANQKQYYGNATVTLIAIDGKIGEISRENKLELAKHIIKQIVTSPWFTRAWTFQEGLLSKQTIFMLDDGIVDGRILSQVWAGIQNTTNKSSVDYNYFISNIPLNNSVFVTPLGWSCGARREQTVNLGLMQSLHAVTHREQTVPLDGIYSILGLLPYGDKVKPEYKPFEHKYTSQELEQSLLEVMKVAVENGYPEEVLSWFGERRIISPTSSTPELWWIPIVKENGSTNTEKVFAEIKPETLKITAQGVELVGFYNDYESGNKNVKFNESLEIQVPTKENSPIAVKEKEGSLNTDNKKRIFIDMVNKKVIVGEQAVQEYQAQIEFYNMPK